MVTTKSHRNKKKFSVSDFSCPVENLCLHLCSHLGGSRPFPVHDKSFGWKSGLVDKKMSKTFPFSNDVNEGLWPCCMLSFIRFSENTLVTFFLFNFCIKAQLGSLPFDRDKFWAWTPDDPRGLVGVMECVWSAWRPSVGMGEICEFPATLTNSVFYLLVWLQRKVATGCRRWVFKIW